MEITTKENNTGGKVMNKKLILMLSLIVIIGLVLVSQAGAAGNLTKIRDLGKVEWDNTTKKAIAVSDGKIVEVGVNANSAIVDGQEVTLSATTKLVDGSLYVPSDLFFTEQTEKVATVAVSRYDQSDLKPGYAGSDACATCHPAKYNDFMVSGHPWKLKKKEIAKNSPLPLPSGYTWEDISYVIGGYKWKARFVDNDGYIITNEQSDEGGNTQWNQLVGTWSDYHADEPNGTKPYDCGNCHTTGYEKEGNQDGLPGMIGTWSEPGVGCEACHGPGAEHIKTADPTKIKIDDSAALCGSCHIRGDKETIPAKGGYIRHHEQYNELLASPHSKTSCTACHDPHKKAEFSITEDKAECATCHGSVNDAFIGSTMEQAGLTCVSCHMPKATKSAKPLGKYQGDIKTHLFRINTDASASMFTEDGSQAKDFVTLDFACLSCHQGRTMDWAADNVENIHSLGK